MYVPDFAPAFFLLIARVNQESTLTTFLHLDAGAFQIRELYGLLAIWAEYFHSQLWLTKY